MKDKLPYSDLFPYLHPLQDWEQIEKYPELASSIARYKDDYKFYLRCYLDEERINIAIAFLKKKFPDVRNFISEFDLTDLAAVFKGLRAEKRTNAAWVIWIYVSVAFMLMNTAIKENSLDKYVADICKCLQNAHEYKRVWRTKENGAKGIGVVNAKKQDNIANVLDIINELRLNKIKDDDMWRESKSLFEQRYPDVVFPYKKESFERNDKNNPLYKSLEK